MKNNSVPVTTRLRRRISGLQGKLPQTVPIGGGNPYHKCSDCERSMPEISGSGHYQGCSLPGIEKEIEHYKRVLSELEDPKPIPE